MMLGLCNHLSLMRRLNQFGKDQPNKHIASSKKKKHILVVNGTDNASMF